MVMYMKIVRYRTCSHLPVRVEEDGYFACFRQENTRLSLSVSVGRSSIVHFLAIGEYLVLISFVSAHPTDGILHSVQRQSPGDVRLVGSC